MKEERMFILNMLNEGKITADEAVNLLNALPSPSASFDEFARGVKSKAADFREKAEPKVKKAAQDIRDRSVEAFGNLKDIIKEKTSQGECAAAADKEDGYAADCDEYVEITAGVDEDYDESTQRDSEMERSDDTLPVEEAEPINEE